MSDPARRLEASGSGPAQARWTRRGVLRAGVLGLLAGPLSARLARADQGARRPGDPGDPGARAPALIVVWLAGGPSQLETFDPHPGGPIGGPTRAVPTAVPGVSFAAGYERLAERLDRMALVRSLVTTEGEHQRGTYLMRTGWPVTPTVDHPAFTAVVARALRTPALEVPAHVALLAEDPPRGGLLGAGWDAFVVGDPARPLEGLRVPGGLERLDRRLADLARLEARFARGRAAGAAATRHAALAAEARAMIGSAQAAAFDTSDEPEATRAAYGDAAFGRACLAARRLVEVGVPAVEVTLGGWDTHVDNFGLHARLAPVLDQGLAALLDDLAARDLLRSTVVLCLGEFGRTPRVNAADGRDHWTRGFPALLAGRGVRAGAVVGATDPRGEATPRDPVAPQDLFATLHHLLGVDGREELVTPAGRPIRLNEGTPVAALLA